MARFPRPARFVAIGVGLLAGVAVASHPTITGAATAQDVSILFQEPESAPSDADSHRLPGAIADALVRLGDLHRDGRIGADEGRRALEFYRRLAQTEDPAAISAVLQPDDFNNGDTDAVDGAAAVVAYQEALTAGQMTALLRLGDLYSAGSAVPRDLERAFGYYQQAAAGGSETGQLRTGEMMALGEGTKQDIDAGLAMVREVAETGSSAGFLLLGDLLSRGITDAISDADVEEAIRAYERAGSLGEAEAWVRLGDLFRNGGVVAADHERAYAYYRGAMEAGSVIGTLRVGELLVTGEGVDRNAAEGLALIESVAAMPSTEALNLLGAIYRDGVPDVVEVDLAKALDQFEKATEAGSTTGKLSLGTLLVRAPNAYRDRSRGLDLIREVAVAGNVTAHRLLGDLLSDAALGPIDAAAAIEAYEAAAEAEDAGALLRLGEIFADSSLVAQDLPRAYAYYVRAKDAGSDTARLRAGQMLATGQGVKKDFAKGIAMVRETAAGGSRSAYIALGDLLIGPHAKKPDAPGAVEAYEQAAALGEPAGWVRLGDLYRDGRFVSADGARAADYYEKAVSAEQGDAASAAP